MKDGEQERGIGAGGRVERRMERGNRREGVRGVGGMCIEEGRRVASG